MKNETKQYAALARFLKDALGENYQVALIDADDQNEILEAGEHGFTQKAISVASRSLIQDILNSTELKKRDYLCSFAHTEGQEEHKHSLFYLRDEAGEITGFLSLDETRNELYPVRDVFDQILTLDDAKSDHALHIGEEVDALLREHITEVWQKYAHNSSKLKKADKIAFISELFEMGIFRIRGGAQQVSQITGISQASLYRYLGEVIEE